MLGTLILKWRNGSTRVRPATAISAFSDQSLTAAPSLPVARRARLETETQRRENLDTLFTSSAKGSSSRSRSSLASVAKSTSKGDFTLDGSDDDDDENAQYVTIPELGKGLSAGGEPGIEPSPLTASTFAPSDGEGGWGIISSPTTTAVGDSTVALNKAEPIFRSNRE